MSFVPVVTPPPPSPRARALAERIRAVIQEQCMEDPGTTSGDVRRALSLAASSAGGNQAARIVAALAVGLLVLGILLALFFSRSF